MDPILDESTEPAVRAPEKPAGAGILAVLEVCAVLFGAFLLTIVLTMPIVLGHVDTQVDLPLEAATDDPLSAEEVRDKLDAMELAKSRWIRVTSNMSLGAYEVFSASADLPEPAWPDLSFERILEIAFRDRVIQDHSHPVLRQLRGEI